jgi:hypothetical protein
LKKVVQDYIIQNDHSFRGTHRDGNILDEIYTNMEIIEGETRDNNISDHLIITYELKGNKLNGSHAPIQKKSFKKKQINELTSMLIEDDTLEINDWPYKSIKEIIIKDLNYRKATIRMYEPPKEYKILKGKDLEDFHLDYRKR